ncbi:membrane biogenesis protein [Sodalis-like endosymbiont of Proechinophthirus fluctus]|uniref:outer membrane protein assembly factor BamE n=1 Tax=Sodalis-like endosymbiont of Proechinophthirus fluctus TaxID=1462730 RepID=UPI0007A843B2|nr:outer membrane protein assembly factor BamE [Sodalis-like endosymbiont of Proechinophthirus fluctus]KYP97047.1 membrane biogenesis protein [Sodalis-like endosymbiont of Proechinophthirus fluctus]
MSRKTLIAAAVFILIFTTSCSVFERLVYRPDINQGNYLTTADVAKIHTGMTKQQVAYTLGTSMMKDPFGSNTWYYIFRREPGYKSVTQQTLTLTFNKSDILTCIDNKLVLEPSSTNQ